MSTKTSTRSKSPSPATTLVSAAPDEPDEEITAARAAAVSALTTMGGASSDGTNNADNNRRGTLGGLMQNHGSIPVTQMWADARVMFAELAPKLGMEDFHDELCGGKSREGRMDSWGKRREY